MSNSRSRDGVNGGGLEFDDCRLDGAGGTHIRVDPKEGMFVVYMIQSASKRAL